ncbi:MULTISPECIES: hypothetical protein [unclassified Streptomyces]|uniref:hypothetical protein n=1 Tax=unclassified Streptomyces TaxID=2593676 RepID=UPI000747EC07|nr:MULTISPECIES: hypothetical protein [unclassified Streptomyces]KUL70950.1 hypothetical protein ADL34_25880 [Streptomyces sp. NRRL WC-3605]KUL72836.1 hypothetical protein ADL33_21940 [Streptomyces sp. NRRL WC-3604]
MTEQQAQAVGPGPETTPAGGLATTEAPAPSAPEPTPAAEPTPVPQEASASPAPPKDRRVLRAVVRWTAAVVVFAAVGAGTAYGIAGMERTDVPGLATEQDGRWDYPTLTRPPLPSGSPRPFAEENAAEAHYADLRALLLPAPAGAADDRALRGEDGWLPTEGFLKEFADDDERADLRQMLKDDGLRHIAARGWTTEDGTHTRIYLLRFDTSVIVDDLAGRLAPFGAPGYRLRGTETSVADEGFANLPWPGDFPRWAYTESKPYGAEQVRQAYLGAGDVLAVIVQSRKGTAASVPFRQTVTLQSQLLG